MATFVLVGGGRVPKQAQDHTERQARRTPKPPCSPHRGPPAPDSLLRMTEAAAKSSESVADVILDIFSKVLDDRSFETFNARVFGMTETPIDIPTFMAVTEDILEELAGKGDREK